MEGSNEHKEDFLRTLARTYHLSQAETRVFLARFAYNKREEPHKAIATMLFLHHTTVQTHLRNIYRKFAESDRVSEEELNLERTRGGKDQFGILFDWLWDRQFPAWEEQNNSLPIHASPSQIEESSGEIEYPEGFVPLHSAFYVERDSVESRCYQNIMRAFALIRIKAPQQMGKTSLMKRVLNYAEFQGCHVAYLDFELVEKSVCQDLNRLLQWLCYSISRQLDLSNRLKEYWDDELLSQTANCTAYFEEYLLQQIDAPLVLGFDAVDNVFPFTEVARDFFGMLRNWHESAKSHEIWKKLRLVVAHSTEVYVPLSIHQSPFNIGVSIELPELTREQVLNLAKTYGLDWQAEQIERIMNMVGGHPHLVRLALHQIGQGNIAIAQLLETAPTNTGIYGNHLRRCLATLKQDSELLEAVKKVVAAIEPVSLDSLLAYKLHSMGLVKWQDNAVTIRCHLYRQYFSQQV
ncbi:MAG: AAA-like domain-containing protein [Cyanobacteria bacterium SBLK]|nr:AAA-like domain-containing protein [Cyanobacteria bacterium SBLK]